MNYMLQILSGQEIPLGDRDGRYVFQSLPGSGKRPFERVKKSSNFANGSDFGKEP
jgi:hypothetical protein